MLKSQPDTRFPIRALAIALIVALLLSGCSQSKDTTPDTEIEAAQDAEVSDQSGAMVGVVVDQTITPIPDVLLKVAGQSTTSNEKGEFVFNGLEEGLHFVTAEAEGFLPIQVESHVVVGKISQVKIVMKADRRVEPYDQTYHFQGRMEAHVGAATAVLVAIMPDTAACDCTFFFTPDSGARTFIVEAFGDPSIANNPTGVYDDVFWEIWAQDNENTEDDETAGVSGHSRYPVHEVVQTGGFSPMVEEYMVRLTGGNWVHVSEDFELFVTVFYFGQPDPAWSIQDQG